MAETPVKNDNTETEATDDMMVGDMIIGAVIFMGNLSIFLGYLFVIIREMASDMIIGAMILMGTLFIFLGYLFRIAQMVYNHIQETYFWVVEV